MWDTYWNNLWNPQIISMKYWSMRPIIKVSVKMATILHHWSTILGHPLYICGRMDGVVYVCRDKLPEDKGIMYNIRQITLKDDGNLPEPEAEPEAQQESESETESEMESETESDYSCYSSDSDQSDDETYSTSESESEEESISELTESDDDQPSKSASSSYEDKKEIESPIQDINDEVKNLLDEEDKKDLEDFVQL
jgi:hypothetical protein